MMTNQEIKRIEDQIRDLQSIVDHYHKDHKAAEIIEKEEELLGKAFKKTDKNGITTYFKPMSLIDINAPYQCHGLRFELPLKPDFIGKARLRMVINREFDYIFDPDWFLYMDEVEAFDLLNDPYEEISVEEYDAALANLMYQVGEFSKKTYTIKSVYGAEYDTKIRNLIREEQEKNDEEEKKE